MQRKKSRANRPFLDPAAENRRRLKSTRYSSIAGVAVCSYWFCFGIPIAWDIPLFWLAGATAWCATQFNRDKVSHRYFQLLGFFTVAILLSIPAAPDTLRSLHFFTVLLPAWMVFYLLSEHASETQLLRLTSCLVLVASLLGLWLLWTAWRVHSGGPAEWVEASGITFFRVPNDATMLAILCPFAFASLLRKPLSPAGISGILCIVIVVVAAVVYRSRLSILLLVIALGTSGILMVGRKYAILGSLVLISLVFAVDYLTGGFLIAKFSSTWDSRLPLWLASWCLFLKAPIFGNGPGSYLLMYRECLAQSVAEGVIQLADFRIAPWAHNLYLEVLGEQGVFGFISLIILLSYGIVSSYRLSRPLEGELRRLNSSNIASLIAFCVAANFELSLWRQWVSVLLFTQVGIAAGIYHVYQTKRGFNE